MSKKVLVGISIFAAVSLLFIAKPVFAHHSGCHNLHTCPSDSSAYVCGDLGYPCDGSTSAAKISIKQISVPLVIEKAFFDTFGRKPTDFESAYWKNRFRNDKDGLYKIRRTMAWYEFIGSFGPKVSIATTKVRLVKNMNAIFASVYGRKPFESENRYWLGRLEDKKTEAEIKNTMLFHKGSNIAH
ncbi:MAG: hypothetical protein Q7S57_04400 [bacterium]|nr:hypothetical protein [bacterium]